MKPQLVRGFRDFYPENWAFQNWLYGKIKDVSERFGFQEYEGPTVESLDLYAAKSGEDLVKKQAFILKDQSGKTLALRPEMTPSLARMIAQKSGELTFPVKWFTYGRRFRYEKPQKGRGREFFQWDIDTLGQDNLEADAEIILIAAAFFQEIGLSPSEVRIKINDRKHVQENLEKLEIPKNISLNVLKVIDKKRKLSRNDFQEMLSAEGLSKKQISKLEQFLSDRQGYQESKWLKGILNIIQSTDLASFVEYDAAIVRGLDYYTRTVFEGCDTKDQFRSIWGGGRYDNLTYEIGGKNKIPGVGFAMGDMVIAEILSVNNKYPSLPRTNTHILVTIFSQLMLIHSIKVADALRQAGIKTELYSNPNIKLEKQFKYANKKNIPFVLVIGPDEKVNNYVTVKNMKTGEQKTDNLDKIIKLLLPNESLS